MAATLSAEEIVNRPELWASPDLPFLPTKAVARDLAVYLDMLSVWNRKLNLVGSSSPLVIMRDLIQDSIFLAAFIEDAFRARGRTTPFILDLGAGAGIPGIPLRLFWTAGKYTWIERRQKRALFLQNVQSRLKLQHMSGYCGEARDFFQTQLNCRPHCIISRAFMPWRQMLEFCGPHIADDGFILFMANESPSADLPAGWKMEKQLAYQLPHRTRWFWTAAKYCE